MTSSRNPRALIVVDAQQGFITAADKDRTTMDYIEWLCHSPQFDVVIATRFINHDSSVFRRFMNYTSMGHDDPASRLNDCVEDRADLVVSKFSYGLDQFQLDYVEELLNNHDIDSALVVGFDTDACVLAVAYSLVELNVLPVIDSRGCASSGGSDVHEAALKIAARNMRVI